MSENENTENNVFTETQVARSVALTHAKTLVETTTRGGAFSGASTATSVIDLVDVAEYILSGEMYEDARKTRKRLSKKDFPDVIGGIMPMDQAPQFIKDIFEKMEAGEGKTFATQEEYDEHLKECEGCREREAEKAAGEATQSFEEQRAARDVTFDEGSETVGTEERTLQYTANIVVPAGTSEATVQSTARSAIVDRFNDAGLEFQSVDVTADQPSGIVQVKVKFTREEADALVLTVGGGYEVAPRVKQEMESLASANGATLSNAIVTLS